ERLGVIKEASEGPLDFSTRACRELPEHCEAINRITSSYIAIRYQHQIPPASLRSLIRSVNAFRH
ncbi:MAG: DUF4129 domain-containing protein, partial [Chromatiales bacterium]|nr:DUF4129 domain-containing protein [Chromatiales bacterium]